MRGNHTSRALIVVAVVGLALSGCKDGRHERDGHTKADIGAIKGTIASDEKVWSDQFQAKPKSLDALVSHYAPDAFFLAPGVKPTTGLADIRKAYEEGLKDPNFNITFASDKIDVAGSGDLATSHGRFAETYTDPTTKQAKTEKGTFLTVYRKQADGSWKAVEDWAVADPSG